MSNKYLTLPFVFLLFISTCSSNNNVSNAGPLPAREKLLQASDLTYLGAFRVPQQDMNDAGYGLSYGGSVIAYNPTNNSLFIVGHDQRQRVAEISIPSAPVKGSNISSMPMASVIQDLYDITDGKVALSANGNKIGGLGVYNNQLIGTAFAYYDASNGATMSHFVSGKTLSTANDFKGVYAVLPSQAPLAGGNNAGFVSGYMAPVPDNSGTGGTNWQNALGGPWLTGNALLSIIGRTSYGPAAFAFDPAKLGTTNPVPATSLLYYDISHQSLGSYDANVANPYVTRADNLPGIVFPQGTQTVIFIGLHGKGVSCYGEVPANCTDPANPYKGGHAYPYILQAYAYDAAYLAKVKEGAVIQTADLPYLTGNPVVGQTMKPWNLKPYAVWDLSSYMPTSQGLYTIFSGAAAYDATNKKLYVVQPGADGPYKYPLIHVFSLNIDSAAPTTQKASPAVSTGASACNAPTLPMTGTRIVSVSTETQLQSAISNLQSGDTIVLANGTYNLTKSLYINNKNNVTIRGASGCDDVVLAGKGMNNSNYGNVSVGFWSNSANTTIAHLTIRDTYDNEIIFNAGAQSPHVYSVKLLNAGAQFIKSNPTDIATGSGVNNGLIEYSWMEYTNGTPNHEGSVGYTNGISAHAVDGWIIRGNLFKNLHTPDTATYLWNPAVLVWNHSRNTITENNVFINVDRAVAYGLQDVSGSDHSGGVIRNNFVYLAPNLMSPYRETNSDASIIVWNSPGSKVYHNTILTNNNVANSIEFRFSTSGAEARNNLADAPISNRDSGTYAQSGNYLSAKTSMFVDAGSVNLHIVDGAETRSTVIDKAAVLSAVSADIDGNGRPSGSNADIGADELANR